MIDQAVLATVVDHDGILDIQFSICLSPYEVINEVFRKGFSMLQLYAEINENFYIVLLPFAHTDELPSAMFAVDRMLPQYIEDFGVKHFTRCLVSDDNLQGLRPYDN